MKQMIRLTEQDLHKIVKESVKKVIKEGNFDQEVNYCPYCGSENIEWMGDAFGDTEEEGTPFHCHQCDTWFGLC